MNIHLCSKFLLLNLVLLFCFSSAASAFHSKDDTVKCRQSSVSSTKYDCYDSHQRKLGTITHDGHSYQVRDRQGRSSGTVSGEHPLDRRIYDRHGRQSGTVHFGSSSSRQSWQMKDGDRLQMRQRDARHLELKGKDPHRVFRDLK